MNSIQLDSLSDIWVIVAAFVVSLLYGLKSVWYTITTGYGLCVFVQAVVVFVLYSEYIWNNPDRVNSSLLLFHLILSVVYAVRLVLFISIRSRKTSYQEGQQYRESKSRSFVTMFFMVSMCGCIYFFMTAPVLAHARSLKFHYPVSVPIRIIGLLIMTFGLIIESVADNQKSEFKKEHPKSYCSTGLYKYLRMPNYFGEMLFWVGSVVAAFASEMSVPLMVSSLLGALSSIAIMFSSGKVLDKKQLQNYGNDPEYLKYRKSTRVILPFIPLYSLTSEKPKDE